MNTRAKGNRIQRKARSYYEKIGYTVETVKHTKYNKNDFFGLWDLMCVRKEDIRFVQVKANQKPAKQWINKAKDWVCPEFCIKEILIWKDRAKEPIIIIL